MVTSAAGNRTEKKILELNRGNEEIKSSCAELVFWDERDSFGMKARLDTQPKKIRNTL